MASKRSENLKLFERYEIVQCVLAGEKQVEVAKRYKVDPKNVSKIMKKKDLMIDQFESTNDPNSKSLKGPKYPQIDKDWLEFVDDTNSRGLPLSTDMIRDEAERLGCLYGAHDFKGKQSKYK